MSEGNHELLAAFTQLGFALNHTLTEMLNEHFSHRTERRGCGFTQATRHLAILVNRADLADAATHLFATRAHGRRFEASDLEELRAALPALPTRLRYEESSILARLITELLWRAEQPSGVVELPAHAGELKVGTCPLTEKYFLEISQRFVRRRGRVNVLVADSGEPLLLEKRGLGDDHSCISVSELSLNGVRLPAGSLFGVSYAEGTTGQPNRSLPGEAIPVALCGGFRFLRLTTLAISPANRARAFSTHFQGQVDAGLFSPGGVTIEDLRRVALEQLTR